MAQIWKPCPPQLENQPNLRINNNFSIRSLYNRNRGINDCIMALHVSSDSEEQSVSPLAGTCTGNVVRQIKINKNKSFVCPLYYATIILIKLYSVHFQSSAFLLFSTTIRNRDRAKKRFHANGYREKNVHLAKPKPSQVLQLVHTKFALPIRAFVHHYYLSIHKTVPINLSIHTLTNIFPNPLLPYYQHHYNHPPQPQSIIIVVVRIIAIPSDRSISAGLLHIFNP